MSASKGPGKAIDDPPRDVRETMLATLFVASFWVLPLLGPVLLRVLGRPRAFALHYFRYALIIQGAFVAAFLFGGVEVLLRGQVEWTSLIVLPVTVWALYGSVVALIAIAGGDRRHLWPVPPRWLWARWERSDSN